MDRTIRIHGTGIITLKSGLVLQGKIIVDFESLMQSVFVKVLNDSDRKEYLMPFDSISYIKWDKIDGTGNWGGIGNPYTVEEWIDKK